ncbi:hypothetical protein Ancab_007409 [Ancistrocladus abbreviatus]
MQQAMNAIKTAQSTPRSVSVDEGMSISQAFKICFCFKRIFKLKVSEPPDDIRRLFAQYAEDGSMSPEQLHKFMMEYQGENNATIEDAQAVFNSLKLLSVFQRRGLNLDAFFQYLFGDLNSPLPPHPKVHHDMKAPLAHYFLYASHNSYLTGNQLNSPSSTEPIISALKRGVRVIELDLWPSKTGDVEVCHGGTMTSPVELIKCLEAIKENAFAATEYPVIITFEDHLDAQLQAKVAKMVTETFGEMLFLPGCEFLKEVPSPEYLRRKIIISTKPPHEALDDTKKKENLQKDKDPMQISEYDEDEDHEEKAVPQYKSLIAIRAGKLKGGLQRMLTVDPGKVRRLSLSELQLEHAIKDHGTDIVRFTQHNILRIYPKGMRIRSSNYNPMTGWMHGAQMVAVNMQGFDKHLWVTHGMFRANGGCGYVKKPNFMLNVDNGVFDPRSFRPVKTTLKVKVYMGDGWRFDFRRKHFDRFSPPDFFTKVQIFGVPADEAKEKTEPIEDEWIPTWNQEFEFPLTVPELALLRIEAREYDLDGRHDFGGQTCLPISELRTGIRAVPLYNRKGEKYRSVKLLMGFQFFPVLC